MIQDMIETGRHATTLKEWQWMPGMAFAVPVDDAAFMACYRYPGPGMMAENGVEITDLSTAIPDLTDMATLGCLLGLVQKAWGCEHIGLDYNTWSDGDNYWRVGADYIFGKDKYGEDTDVCAIDAVAGVALVEALEAAP